mmetsp:Transcript_38890/g.77178  ORF Transcript_38890/g.77178 Transcript_38890/m.77178 type:complete len:99 (+) Transcript_38890:264-560(+)
MVTVADHGVPVKDGSTSPNLQCNPHMNQQCLPAREQAQRGGAFESHLTEYKTRARPLRATAGTGWRGHGWVSPLQTMEPRMKSCPVQILRNSDMQDLR